MPWERSPGSTPFNQVLEAQQDSILRRQEEKQRLKAQRKAEAAERSEVQEHWKNRGLAEGDVLRIVLSSQVQIWGRVVIRDWKPYLLECTENGQPLVRDPSDTISDTTGII